MHFSKGPPRHNFTRLITTDRLEQALVFTGQLDTGVGNRSGIGQSKTLFQKLLKQKLIEMVLSKRIFSLD